MKIFCNITFLVFVFATGDLLAAGGGESPRALSYPEYPPAPAYQDWGQANLKSEGCQTCHTETDQKTMHSNPGVILGCTDCHGGNANIFWNKASKVFDDNYARENTDTYSSDHGDTHSSDHGDTHGSNRKYNKEYEAVMGKAHVQPLYPDTWHYPHSANPERTYTLLNKESPEFIRFVNPSDYRVARESCGACHLEVIQAAERSLMATGGMLFGGAAYNNGILPFKNYILGEAYTREGQPASMKSPGIVEEWMTKERGILPDFVPMPEWEVIPPGDVFRVFERGGRNIVNLFPEIGLPNISTLIGSLQKLEEPGRPDIKQSNRGPGTGLRIAVPVINIHKTRLNDPFTWFMGTNDQPGDFRTSGCGACHIVYANDRDPLHSGPYAEFGHMGETQTIDPTIPKNEPGHPLKHEFTTAIPTSQCMVCHMHQPNIFLNSMLGYTMWDYESDAQAMWPKEQKYPDAHEMRQILDRNPEEAAIRGKWGDVEFLKNVSDLNPDLKNTQFADYHGHGWNFRAIFKKDRKGNLLDANGGLIDTEDPEKWEKAVHMKSIHVEVGMHCVDCHFAQDTHGNGFIHGEVANAIEIRCVDCHGSADKYPTTHTSGPAAKPGGTNLGLLRLSDGRRRFEWVGSNCEDNSKSRDCKLVQRSAVNPGLEWDMSLVKDSVDPDSGHYNAKAARAKLVSSDTSSMEWGLGVAAEERAHKDEDMECFTCHLSWTTSCAGCHLPIQANWKTERHKYQGGETRNFATYNPQVTRDQMFQLGVHQTTKGNTIAPIRSTSALILSSTNINRERIYIQQPPIAASGYSSQAFAPHFPHTVRKTETKTCTDCHLSEDNDNNAIMAQLLLHGTNFVNFVGYNAWIGGSKGLEAVRVTEFDEPQAVIGSFLHKYAYPDWYKEHQNRSQKLYESYKHRSSDVGCLQLRGEYLFVAGRSDGFRAYDVAGIANKGVSQRIITAPFGPLGHDTRIKSKHATCMALPTNQPMAPGRMYKDEETRKFMQEVNQEQPIHAIYSYAFVTDQEEGLIVVNVDTLSDGEARNNFFERALTWNPDGVLSGARHITLAGSTAYIAGDFGVAIIGLEDPLEPQLLKLLPFNGARATAVQFRYLFVTDNDGFHVVDITTPASAFVVEGSTIPLSDAHKIYVARTFAYVAAGKDGLAIIDVEFPSSPTINQMFNGKGQIQDAKDVIVGTTNASLFAYVADGKYGLKVIQLTSPERQPLFYGFSPDPKPEIIAWWPTKGDANALSKGLDRDRGVDETGNQMAVFGRLGSRPFTLAEQRKLFVNANGEPWFVNDEVDLGTFLNAK